MCVARAIFRNSNVAFELKTLDALGLGDLRKVQLFVDDRCVFGLVLRSADTLQSYALHNLILCL